MKLFKKKKEEIADVMQSRKFAEFGETSYTEKTRAVIKSTRWL